MTPVAQTAVYPVPPSDLSLSWSIDAARGQLLAGRRSTMQGFLLGDDLIPRASVDLGYLGLFPPASSGPLRFLPSTVRNRTFVFAGRDDYTSSTAPTQPGQAFLVAMDAGTLAPAATVDLISTSGFPKGGGYGVLLSPPPPPKSLTASVAGGHVDLQWRDPGDATHFVVEVGSVPGRSTLGIFHTATPGFAADSVPPGRYLRSRAGAERRRHEPDVERSRRDGGGLGRFAPSVGLARSHR